MATKGSRIWFWIHKRFPLWGPLQSKKLTFSFAGSYTGHNGSLLEAFYSSMRLCGKPKAGSKAAMKLNLNLQSRLGYVPEAQCRIMSMLAVHKKVLVSQFGLLSYFLFQDFDFCLIFVFTSCNRLDVAFPVAFGSQTSHFLSSCSFPSTVIVPAPISLTCVVLSVLSPLLRQFVALFLFSFFDRVLPQPRWIHLTLLGRRPGFVPRWLNTGK